MCASFSLLFLLFTSYLLYVKIERKSILLYFTWLLKSTEWASSKSIRTLIQLVQGLPNLSLWLTLA